MATVWFAISPQGESQGSALSPEIPAGTVIVGVVENSANYNALIAGSAVQHGGKPYIRFMGPFKSAAEAKAAKPPGGVAALGQIVGAGVHAAAPEVPGGAALTNPLSGLANLDKFFSALADPATWIRVAKVLVGGTVLIVGLAHLTGVDNAVAKVARSVPLPV